MKLVVEKVGRIEKAEIEIRPMTVFIGENGTGKTWTAMGLFALLAQLRAQGGPLTRADQEIEALLNERAWKLRQQASLAAGEARFDIARSDLVKALPERLSFTIEGAAWARLIGDAADDELRQTLEVTRDEFADGAISRAQIALSLQPYVLRQEFVTEGAIGTLTSTSYGSDDLLHDPQKDIVRALRTLLYGWRADVRILPVERELLAQIFVQLPIFHGRMRLPSPLEDFCEFLAKTRAPFPLGVPSTALRLEAQRIIGGRFHFIGANRELVFSASTPDGERLLPVAATASAQKSLAGLELFLEVAGPRDILIIDEPELSAHPEAQVKLVELFALMIRAGIQLVIVTHSPYIVDHISTIIEMSRLDPEQRAHAAEALALKNPESYLKPDEVAVWQFGRDGKVTSKYNEENRSIDGRTFTKVTDRESVAINRILDEADEGNINAG